MTIFDAIDAGDITSAIALIAADPSIGTTRDAEGATPVLHAMYRHQFAEARTIAGQITASGGRLDLAEAAALDEAARTVALLDAGAPVDGRGPDGFTALQLAAYFGAPDSSAVLIAAGADVNAVSANPMRIQPLHAAAAGRHTSVAVQLIAAGADVDATQQHGWTPLLSAAHNGDAELVSALLAAGASTTPRNDDGQTAADVARRAGHDDLADRLS